MITQEELKKLFNYNPETGLFTRLKSKHRPDRIGEIAGTTNSKGYIKLKINGNVYSAHRLAWLYMYGKLPENEIDHTNRIKDDNRICNLRDVTSRGNNFNKGTERRNISGVTGVTYYKRDGTWLACIRYAGEYKHLGYFDDMEDAIKARKNAEQQYLEKENLL